MTLPELAVKHRVTTLVVIISMVVLGAVAVVRLPLAFLPDMEEPELFVRLPYPNASPEQVERLIARPVEDALGSVSGLKKMWSRCGTEGGMVRLELDWSADLHLARVEVWEKIERIRRDLPEDLEDVTVGTSWDSGESDNPVLEARLSADTDLSASYDLLERRIVRPLQRVPGVAQVVLDGVNPREVRINLRLDDLELHQIDVREVSRLLRTANFDQSLGKLVEGESRYTLRTVGSFKTVDEVRNLVLRGDGLRVEDIADVIYREPPLELGRHLDGKFAVGITASAEAKANSVEVCDALEARIRKMGGDPELAGVNLLLRFSEGAEIKKSLKELLSSGIIGALLSAVVLLVFLRRLSATAIAVGSIPFSLVVTCGVVWARGGTLNTLTLLGLIVGVGMLVDNAVVVMENIFRHQEAGQDRKTATLLGASEVSTAVITATLTSVIVFLPIVFNKPSEMNIQFQEIGITVCLTLLASLFISQTLIPLATSWCGWLKPRPKERWLLWLEEKYARILRFNLHHRWLAPVVCLLVTLSALFPLRGIDVNFDSDEGELRAAISYEFSEPTTLEKKEAFVTQVETALEPYRRELMARYIYSFWRDNFATTRIYLTEGEASEENLAKVRTRLREILPALPGVKLEVSEGRRSWQMDRGKRVAFQLVGENSEVLATLGEEARRRLREIPGLTDTFAGNQEGQRELHVGFDRELAARYGVPPAQVGEAVGLTFRGRRLQRFRTPDGEREMRLTLDERETESLAQLENLPLRTASGDKVPLAAIATFREAQAPERIERDDRRTSLWVGASYENGTREDYLPMVKTALEAMTFPAGYSWTFGSWQVRQEERSRELLVNLALALVLVFAVMAGLFESVRQATALMIALPFALAGAAWTLYLTGTDFDQPAAVGVLLLIGIVVQNGIVLIEHTNGYRRQGVPREEAMLRGGKERLRPILMTALTTLFGLVPIVLERPSLGGMCYYSMALVMMGGLALSTVLTLVLLPTTATLIEDVWRVLARRPRTAA